MANPKIEVEIGAKTGELSRKLKETDNSLSKTGKSFGKLNEFAIGALSGIAAAFSIGAILSFGKAVLDTTAKFQKFEAILSNTLGSDSAAQLALAQITKFASVTPFAVDELTGAFVKLANQGFKPTIGELRQLGDLASSTGKSFDQLAEAVIDAQVGEFERLKEFGIRAKKSGDNVIFTFKGVETQVKNTAEALQGYVVSLGDAEGVSGAMAKISETLGGKMSNLGDNIDSLKLAIGNQTSGAFAASLDWLNSFVAATTRATKGVAKIRAEADLLQSGKSLDASKKAVLELADSYQLLDSSKTRVEALTEAISKIKEPFVEAKKGGEAFLNQPRTVAQLKDLIQGIEDLGQELLTAAVATKPLTAEQTKLNEELTKTAANLARIQKLRANAPKSVGTTNIAQTDFNAAFSPKKIDGTGTGLGFADQFNLANANFADSVSNAPGLSLEKIFPSVIDFESFIKDLLEGYADVLDKEIPTFAERVKGLVASVNDTFVDRVPDSIENFSLAIGAALANGGNVIEAIGTSLLSSMAKFLGDFGKNLIAFGVAGYEFGKLSLALTNPFTAVGAAPLAIAAGIALTALSGAIGSIGNKGIGRGGGSGSSGVGSGGTFTGSGSNSFDPMRMFKIEVVGSISGEAIGFALAQGQNRKN